METTPRRLSTPSIRLLATLLGLVLPPAIHAGTNPETLLVSTANALLAVDPITGSAHPLGDGSLVATPAGVAQLPGGEVVVLSGDQLVVVDPTTDQETLLATIPGTQALTVEADGSILAGGVAGGLARIDPTTGVATPMVPGSATFRPSCLAVAGDGTIFASDDGIDGFGGIHRIDPITAMVSLVPSPVLDSGMCLTIHGDGLLVVTLVAQNELWLVDPSDGSSTLLATSGAHITGPYLVAVTEAGRYYVDTFLNGPGVYGIVEIEPGTGNERVVWSGPSPPNALRGLAVASEIPSPLDIPALSRVSSVLLILLLAVAALGFRNRF